MKKSLMIVFLVALLATVLPAGALAGKRQNFEVSVRNRSGADAVVNVVNAQGQSSNFQVSDGYSTIHLEEGKYDYYVSSACGNIAGRWNLNVDKTLWIECGPVGPIAEVARPQKGAPTGCGDYGFFVDWGGYVEFNSETHWNPWVISWEQNVQGIYDAGATPVFGCITDLPYDGYYSGE